MIGMRISWFALEGVLLVLFACFGSAVSLVLAMLLVLIPLVSLAVNCRVSKKLHIRLEGAGNLRKEEQGTVWILLENGTVFPVLWVCCKVQARNQLNQEQMTVAVSSMLAGRGKCCIPVQTGSAYCGRIRLSLAQVTVYDCFGLLGIRRRPEVVTHVTVQPDTFDMQLRVLPNARSIDESDIYSQERPGDDLTETYQIREYVPGDNPRKVHWKLSGKFDRLIVRDPALPIIRNILVFWERTGEPADQALIDAQAEVIVSVCRGLIDQGMVFSVGWNDTDRDLCIVHEIPDMDALVGILPRLMRATGKPDGVSGADLLVRTRPDALCSHMLYLAAEPSAETQQMREFGNVTMLVCSENAPADSIIFDAVHYPQQLSQIDL